MGQYIAQVTLVIRDYDEAIEFYTNTLGFELVEDTVLNPSKRWVVVKPTGSSGVNLLLAKASTPEQLQCVGNQTGGRVFLFLYTDNLWRDYRKFQEKGVKFIRSPSEEIYGIVAVFADLYGNLWDLLEPRR